MFAQHAPEHGDTPVQNFLDGVEVTSISSKECHSVRRKMRIWANILCHRSYKFAHFGKGKGRGFAAIEGKGEDKRADGAMPGTVFPASVGKFLANAMPCNQSVTQSGCNHAVAKTDVSAKVSVMQNNIDAAINDWPHMILQPCPCGRAGGKEETLGECNASANNVKKRRVTVEPLRKSNSCWSALAVTRMSSAKALGMHPMESMDLAHGTSMKAIKGMEKGQPWGIPRGCLWGRPSIPATELWYTTLEWNA